ncbi:MAG: DUF1499 domain-containing protein [Pseudomonadota bacterium]
MKVALLVTGALLLFGIGGFYFLGQKSQSGTAPGLSNGRLSACPSSPNCVCSEGGTPEEKRVDILPAEVWVRLPDAIARMGGNVTAEDTGYLAAEFTSDTFKFVDDLEFRRTDDGVHVRSASRVGYSDRGVNAARVATLRTALGL